ncbi:MAG: tRNA pseudouridine(38-40) synthase TruA [Firmicutes bacterium]|nr:tRNA pseudouridine(38-40) synthase TruA [Bacillota bacterium]
MQNYKMKIAYDGRKYVGFNISKGNAEKSIQGKLEAILSKLYNEEVEVVGAVNTDAGVSAKGQIVNFRAPNGAKSTEEIFEYFETYLTDDIIILSVDKVDERFHSRYNVEEITYVYRLWKVDAPNRPLFERQFVNLMKQKLDIYKMKRAAKDLLGEHDLLGFTTNKKTRKSVKEIFEIEVNETSHEIVISMTADGYLLNMERVIVGTLVQIGLGQLQPNAIEKALQSKNMKDVGHKASAGALCLERVGY